MSHFAKVVNGIVENVIVAEQDFIDSLPDAHLWIQTSYNTRGGIHYDPETKLPSADQSKALRKNFAQIGGRYSAVRDAFIPIKAFPSLVFDEESCIWVPPIPMPEWTEGITYVWEEETLSWVKVPK